MIKAFHFNFVSFLPFAEDTNVIVENNGTRATIPDCTFATKGLKCFTTRTTLFTPKSE
jgi:hypothetical protein